MRRFGLAAVARIREAEATRSSRLACRAAEEARSARERAVALEARVAGPASAGAGLAAPGPAAPRHGRRARGLAEDARSRELLERARRNRAAEAKEARSVAEVLGAIEARSAAEALLARRRADGLARAGARWREALRRESAAREEREVEEAWVARPRGRPT